MNLRFVKKRRAKHLSRDSALFRAGIPPALLASSEAECARDSKDDHPPERRIREGRPARWQPAILPGCETQGRA